MADTDRPTIAAPSVLEMARECGATITPFPQLGAGVFDASMTESQLTAFAERIRADEREKCAKVCEALDCAHRCGVGAEVARAVREGTGNAQA